MGVIERIREIGVLRAIGMTRRQVMRMVVVEAAILGLVGVVLGSSPDSAPGSCCCSSAAGSDARVGIPWLPIGVAAVLGLVLPALAALYPAPRRISYLAPGSRAALRDVEAVQHA